ncbi:response regulator [Paenibacillus taichungensis]|uniref:response regulator n=1 Tax=Paenibacillus TaxID=44249 RepID=UPI00096EDB5B|nr:response regulator [Paenibacillus taichungensis]MDR9745730.1 response regulator [Paenibacillus taichungensis]MEC0107675.1 response regulator [Paenibacillus taichungensis]MEC0195871.1 response regulator [Paenibacillus taichungensis]OME83366.1 DNA-binding response regulator [Paenibacillus pabuli]
MFQVLLVDDEPLVRHNLWTLLDWADYGFELCGQAHNGLIALTMIEQSPPHIVIIDVDMPEMSGVELNRTIKERFPGVKTIMLSSYDDYDYVRDCLNNGSIDYLLKHRLDESTLLNILNKAVSELQQENRLREKQFAESVIAEKVSPEDMRDYLLYLLKRQTKTTYGFEDVSQKDNLYPHASRYATAALQIVPFLLLTESYSDVQTNGLVQQVVDMMQQSLGDIHERTAVYVEEGRFVIVFSFRERSEHIMQREVDGQLRKIQHALELFLNLQSVTAVGPICTSLSQLASSYCSAEYELDGSSSVKTFRSHTLQNETPCSDKHSHEKDQSQRVSLTIEEQKQLLLSIERFDKQGVHQLISSIFASIDHLPIHSHTVQMVVSELMQTGDKAWRTCLPSTDPEVANLPSRSELGRMKTIRELEQGLQSFFSSLFHLLNQHRVIGSYSRHVTQTIHFILERYSGYVTLELAASVIGLNASYLSRIFKEETQRTFSEYVNQVRIDAGCKLLDSGRYSIKEISMQVGFTTHNYFFKVFKEITGLTPQAYLSNPGKRKNETKLPTLHMGN